MGPIIIPAGIRKSIWFWNFDTIEFMKSQKLLRNSTVRCRPSHTVIHWPIPESKFVDLRVFRANVGTLRGSSGEPVGMLEHRSVDICCLLETRFRGTSVRIISWKAAQYKLLWIENGKGLGEQGIFLVNNWAG